MSNLTKQETKKELCELLFKNAVLIHKVLRDSARLLEEAGFDDLAKFRNNLAETIDILMTLHDIDG